MSVASALAAGRARHALLLIEACTVQRKTGEVMGANDKITPTFSSIYTGPCRVKAFRTGHQAESGQVAVLKRGYDVQIPWDAVAAAGGIERGDILTVTTSNDAWLVGRPLTVVEINYAGTQTVRHILVEDMA